MRDKKHVFKRGLSLFLALTMCLSLLQVTAFAAAGEKHSYDGHCAECEKGKAPGHHEHGYDGATLTTYCKCCGAILWAKDAGYTKDKGTYCGLNDKGHNMKDVGYLAPTCTEPGHEAGKTCVICGKVEGQEEIPALTHKSTSGWLTDSDNHWHTCTNLKGDGTTECGVVLDEAAHSYGRDGTCVCGLDHEHELVWTRHESDDGKHWQACSANECSYVTVQADHLKVDDSGVIHTKNDTTEVWKCVCGLVIQEIGIVPDPAPCEHKWEYTVNYSDGTHTAKCSMCGAVDTQDHTWEVQLDQVADCTQGSEYLAVCTGCGHRDHRYGPRGDHKHDYTYVSAGEDRHGYRCSVCNQIVNQKKHDLEKVDGQNPTCNEEGYTQWDCKTCEYTRKKPIAKLEHVFAGTYEQAGTSKHAKVCTEGHTYDAEPHAFDEGIVVKEPTCTDDGEKKFTCVCGLTKKEAIPATGHQYNDKGVCENCGDEKPVEHTHEFTVHVATASVPATCETVGKDVYKCKVAGCTERWTFDLAPLGHDFSGEPVITESTEGCMKGGVKTWTCQRQGCDATKEEPVDAQVSHTYGDKIAEKPAACEVPGMKEHYECEVCGKLFVGTHEVSAEDLEIPALEHSFTHYVPDNNGSCTTAGTETAVCDNGCGETDTRTVAGTGEGHTVVVDAAVAPTCTETGLTEGSHCSACGEVLAEQEVVEAAGHQYDDGVTVTVPDCNHAGATRFTCEVCGDSYEEADSPFGHEVVSYASVAATCTANGYTGGSYCSRCGSVITARTVVPAVGHSWNAGVVTTQPTYYNTGVRTYTCARDASHTYTETIPALTYPGGGGGGSYNPVTPVTPVTPNVPVTPNNPVNIPDANVPQGSTPDGLTTIEDENTPLGGITFVDVTPTDWFYDAVQYVFEKGLMLGVSDTEFGPNLSTTRGMIVTILYRMEGEPETAAAPFTDVEPGLWYSNAIGWGAANDIVNGYGDGRFGPNDQITREQMAAIFYRYAQYKGYDVTARADLSGYADADQISEYAVEAMQWAVGVKLVNGLTADTLVPKGQATRAQVATMLMRFDQEIAAA